MPPIKSNQDTVSQEILTEFREMNSEIIALRLELEMFKQAFEPITKIVRGDGTVQSLGTQIELLKQEVAFSKSMVTNNSTMIKEVNDRNNKIIKDMENRQQQIDKDDRKGRMIIIAALITGSLALVGTIVQLIKELITR